MKTSTKLASGTLALAIVAFTVTSVSAYKGDPNVQGPNHSPERHEAMTNAFESNNYEAWVALMDGRGRVTQVVNADNFSQFAEAHKLAQEGDLEGAKAIRTELGLGLKNGSGRGQGKGQGRGQGLQDGSGQGQQGGERGQGRGNGGGRGGNR